MTPGGSMGPGYVFPQSLVQERDFRGPSAGAGICSQVKPALIVFQLKQV
jgi:hypothetical protein